MYSFYDCGAVLAKGHLGLSDHVRLKLAQRQYLHVRALAMMALKCAPAGMPKQKNKK